jgi:predicted regulator of Ras-like GTPase activity (Roadblock/LC7/MglB family)
MSREIGLLQREIRRNPGTAAFARLADHLREQGELAEATWVCSRGLAVSPGYSGGHTILAEILAAENLLRRAKEEFSTALALESSNVRARLGLAKLLVNEGSTQAALEQLDHLLFWQPEHPQARELNQKALSLVNAKQVDALIATEPQWPEISDKEEAPPVPAGLVPGREHELVELLADCESTSGAVVIDKEGLIVASQHEARDLTEEAAAFLTNIACTANRYLSVLGTGPLESCIVEGEQRTMQVLRFQGYLVAIALRPDAKLGTAEMEVTAAIGKLDRRRKVRISDGYINDLVRDGHEDA